MTKITDEAAVRRYLVRSPRQRDVPSEIYAEIARAGALLEGHFILQNGQHSEHFLRFSQIAADRSQAERIAKLVRKELPQLEFDTVVCSEAAGLYLGAAFARLSK